LELYLGGLNGNHLLNLLLEADRVIDGERRTEEVWAAVAYATGSSGSGTLISHCFQKGIPLKFWGRLDDQVAVDVGALNLFLHRSSPDFVCKLVPKHHAKVIWWRGFGIYIGSANLTYSAWNRNIEAGCFFEEEELTTEQVEDFERMFQKLDEKASPLTEELRDLMIARGKKIAAAKDRDPDFWKHPSVTEWGGLVTREPKPPSDARRDSFLMEWNETLQYLRDIAVRVSQPEYRPHWIADIASPGAQADQFLHAHYYNNTFDGQQAAYERHYNENRFRREAALENALQWWALLPAPPSKKYDEETTVNVVAPMMTALLAEDSILTLTKDQFRHDIVAHVHSVMEYARRVRNEAVGLPGGQPYTLEAKQDALADYLWAQHNHSGQSIIQLLHEVLYGGPNDLLPERLWTAISDPKKKIDRFGISAVGETIGWANPDRFPPRNGRTSKALRSLGYNVKVHVG
jgi:hypothetical protein